MVRLSVTKGGNPRFILRDPSKGYSLYGNETGLHLRDASESIVASLNMVWNANGTEYPQLYLKGTKKSVYIDGDDGLQQHTMS